MKKALILFISPLPFIYFAIGNSGQQVSVAENSPSTVVAAATSFESTPVTSSSRSKFKSYSLKQKEEIITYAQSLLGSPYVYAGKSLDGFDCSGFTSYVYENFGIDVGRSSSMQANDGIAIDRSEAKKGDLLIFTGTDLSVREPGHVGIVVSSPGDTISFIHSSSNGGVKISQVEGSRYNDRLLQIRRVL